MTDLSTKQKIIEVSMRLFAVKGFDGVSVREIAKEAQVNVAAINYHFTSKENLRKEVMEYLVNDFKARITSVKGVTSTAQYAVKFFEALIEDPSRCLNQFKLILEAESRPCETEPYPVCYEQFSLYLEKELNPSIPQAERQWLVNIVMSYIVHIAVMSSTQMGRGSIERFFPKKMASLPEYITQLVETLIRDLNRRYE